MSCFTQYEVTETTVSARINVSISVNTNPKFHLCVLHPFLAFVLATNTKADVPFEICARNWVILHFRGLVTQYLSLWHNGSSIVMVLCHSPNATTTRLRHCKLLISLFRDCDNKFQSQSVAQWGQSIGLNTGLFTIHFNVNMQKTITHANSAHVLTPQPNTVHMYLPHRVCPSGVGRHHGKTVWKRNHTHMLGRELRIVEPYSTWLFAPLT